MAGVLVPVKVAFLSSEQGISSGTDMFISQKVFIKSFCKSEFPHKFVNVSFMITDIENTLTDLCGN